MCLIFRWDGRDHKGSGHIHVIQRQGKAFTRLRGRAENIVVFNFKLWLLFRLTHCMRLLAPTNRKELWTFADKTRCAAKHCIIQWLKLPMRWLNRRDWKVSWCCLWIFSYFSGLHLLLLFPSLSFTTGSGRDGVKGRAGSTPAPLQCWRWQSRECLPIWWSHLFLHYI